MSGLNDIYLTISWKRFNWRKPWSKSRTLWLIQTFYGWNVGHGSSQEEALENSDTFGSLPLAVRELRDRGLNTDSIHKKIKAANAAKRAQELSGKN